MTMTHVNHKSRFDPIILLAVICLVLAFGSAAAAEETEGENETAAEEITGDGRTVLGGYTFQRSQAVESPNIFVSRNPSTDTIVFQDNAVLDATVPFVYSNFEQWTKWRRETDSNPGRVEEYGLNPLSIFTIGNAYNAITLEKGVRVINRAEESDGMFILGPTSINIKEDTLTYGSWAGISLANFEDAVKEDVYEVSIVNQGRIGSFVDESGTRDENGDFPLMSSKYALLLYEGVIGGIVNESSGIIDGQSFGMRISFSESQGDFIPFGDSAIDYFEGSYFNLENHGEIIGRLYDGIFEGGGLENISIINHESGLIQGGRTGIVLSRGGDIDNRGAIRGGETGIFISTGTANIIHSGEISVTGEEGGDAILFGPNAVGGTVALYAGVEGGIQHSGSSSDGNSGNSSEAALSIYDTVDSSDASIGNIAFGEGSITQYGGAWTYKDITAGVLQIESGVMRLSENISVDGDIIIASDATMRINGGAMSAENFINRGILNFNDGEITINGGLFDWADPGSPADLVLAGAAEDQSPHLRLADGAAISGVDYVTIGGVHAGSLTLLDARATVPGGLEIRDKGRLAGTGLIQSNVIAGNGGIISPGYAGDATGTLSIEGDLIIEKDSTVDIGIMNGDNNNAVIDATGDVSIAGGTVNVTDLSGRRIADGSVYTFLMAGQSVAGQFDAITGSPIFAFDLDYGYNNASFKVTRLTDYEDFAATPNQESMAWAYQTARDDGYLPKLVPEMEKLLEYVLEEKGPPTLLEGALELLSPEPYQASFRMTADTVGHMNRHLMNGARQTRLKMALAEPEADDQRAWIVPGQAGTSTWDKPFRLFYGTFYRFADVDPDAMRTGYYQRTRGFYLGYERPVGTRANGGVSFAYSNNNGRFNDGRGELEIESFRIGPHATVALGNLEIDLALNGGRHKNYQERVVIYPLPATALTRYKIYDASTYTDIRYSISPAGLFCLTPSASLQYTYQHRENIKEKNGGDINLHVQKDSFNTLRGMLGLKLSREIRRNSAVIVPELFGGWRNEMGDRDVDISASFIGAPDSPEGGFTVTGQCPEREFYVAGVGITFLFGEFNVAYLGYEREFRDTEDVETYSGGVKWNF